MNALLGGTSSPISIVNILSAAIASSILKAEVNYRQGNFEDAFSARAGFVWKLGKPVNSELISMKEKEFQTKIISLEKKNQELYLYTETMLKFLILDQEGLTLKKN
mgnify:CR=1 FL=1